MHLCPLLYVSKQNQVAIDQLVAPLEYLQRISLSLLFSKPMS